MSEETKCAVCGDRLSVRWSDTHGIGACLRCGLPYRIYHYDDNNARVDKPPSLAVDEEWLPLAREYWSQTSRRVFPGAFDMGIFAHRERTYSGASEDEMRDFDEWMVARKDRWPANSAQSDDAVAMAVDQPVADASR